MHARPRPRVPGRVVRPERTATILPLYHTHNGGFLTVPVRGTALLLTVSGKTGSTVLSASLTALCVDIRLNCWLPLHTHTHPQATTKHMQARLRWDTAMLSGSHISFECI